MGGNFTTVIGFDYDSLETEFTVLSGVKSGDTFRFRFRAKNVNGWSSFSPISHIKAATIPLRPPAPKFVDATSSSLTLALYESD